MNGTSWKVILAFLVVFVAGGAIGTVFTLRLAPPVASQPPKPEQFGPQLMRRFLRNNRFGLTPAQFAQIRPIVADAAEELRRTQRENQHSSILIIERMQDAIAAVMTPEQRAKFNKSIKETRQRMQQYNQELQRLKDDAEPPAPPK